MSKKKMFFGGDKNPYPVGVNLNFSRTTDGVNNNVGSLLMTPDGTNLNIGCLNGVHQRWGDGIAFDWESMSYQDVTSFAANTNRSMNFNGDGSGIIVSEANGVDSVWTRTLATNYTIVTAGSGGIGNLYDFGFAIHNDIVFSQDGLNMYVTEGTRLRDFGLSASFIPDTVTSNTVITTLGYTPGGIKMPGDGLIVFIIDVTNSKVRSYPLSISYDLSTIGAEISNFDFPVQMFALEFGENGKKMYVSRINLNTVYEYTLNPAYTL